MKLWVGLFGLLGIGAGFLRVPPAEEPYVLFLAGDSNGYLSPCGCSDPMMGGAKRRATAIKKLGQPNRTIVLENGGFVKAAGRQDEIKIETFAELHKLSSGAAINLCYSEAKLGPGAIASLANLSGNRLITSSLEKSSTLDLPTGIKKGPFLIGGVSSLSTSLGANLGETPVPVDKAVQNLLDEAQRSNLKPLLMLDGNRADAERIAKAFPTLALIQYKSVGHPPEKVEKVGSTLLVTPGDGGKSIVRLVWRGNRFVSYVPVELQPSYKDDPDATRLYRTYLRRVTDEKLLEQLPRSATEKFSGSETCMKCHAQAGKVWKHSKHAEALVTLEKEGHDRDPDCVECHVVGLASLYGFRTRTQTPGLAAVGCESCHGPGARHSAMPKLVKMGKIGEKECLSCHRAENSPKFDFRTYWDRIKHK